MRITNAMISNSYLKNLNNNLTELERYHNQLATGNKLTKLSDDPIGVMSSMQVRTKLGKLAQYQKNVDTAKTWHSHTEGALIELNRVLQSAYEASLKASTGTLNQSDRRAVAEEVKQLRDHVFMLGNTKVGDKYIFGGYNTSKAPFTLDPLTGTLNYNGINATVESLQLEAETSKSLSFEIGFDITIEASLTGVELLGAGEHNIYHILNGLYDALQNGSAQDASGYIERILGAQENVLAELAVIGGKTTRLDLLENRYAEDELNFTGIKSAVEDTDQAEAVMQYKMAESVYLFALKVGSNILQPTLLDYLR
ncbi:MAG TPA: flagellar hook-associated protein FlgL [Clostridia bacterium]|nr:MAG: Flagellar hook-associated protein 3 [Firmicutes bacterium ADurb.Bin356]HOR12320.1 flagellar hook-associated protein FlgL [Clostridia bacterium]